MSNLSDYLEATAKLQQDLNADKLTENEKEIRISNLYFNAIALALVTIADDIHELSRAVKDISILDD
ncbi:MAG: hypothetical protein IKO76_06690 [Butyrivibrio sp.]|nr:hypothetical protein [Butyrivibrio sp.]